MEASIVQSQIDHLNLPRSDQLVGQHSDFDVVVLRHPPEYHKSFSRCQAISLHQHALGLPDDSPRFNSPVKMLFDEEMPENSRGVRRYHLGTLSDARFDVKGLRSVQVQGAQGGISE